LLFLFPPISLLFSSEEEEEASRDLPNPILRFCSTGGGDEMASRMPVETGTIQQQSWAKHLIPNRGETDGERKGRKGKGKEKSEAREEKEIGVR